MQSFFIVTFFYLQNIANVVFCIAYIPLLFFKSGVLTKPPICAILSIQKNNVNQQGEKASPSRDFRFLANRSSTDFGKNRQPRIRKLR